MKIDTRRLKFVDLAVVLLLLGLPYYLFDRKFFIGGDDTRLFYAFPELWLKHLGWFSWFHLSGPGQHNPQQFIVPLLTVFSGLREILPQLVVFNLAFSLPLILGYLFFQKMLLALLEEPSDSTPARMAGILGGLFFVFSPVLWGITITTFLYSVWLIALAPILGFCFVRYLQTSKWTYVLGGVSVCMVLALAIFSVPWLLGILLPLVGGLAVCAMFFRLSEILRFLRGSAVFSIFIGLTQLFWILPFFMSLLEDSGSFVGVAMSAETQDTFRATVMGTMSRNNLFFPMINLFHRPIAFDFDWPLKSVFESSYDKLILLNLIFVVIVVLALVLHRRVLSRRVRNSFYVFVASWLVAVFLFTVNIGLLRDLFLRAGAIPGFGMFRNAYDKFAIGYVFVFSILIGFSLFTVLKSSWGPWLRYRKYLLMAFVLALIAGAAPVRKVVNRRLWTTPKTATVISIPQEYLNFMNQVQSAVQMTGHILSLPFAYPAYTVIKAEKSEAVYAGSSPVKVFTGLNDFSGLLSFPKHVALDFQMAIQTMNEEEVRNFLKTYNIGYIFLTKNVPRDVARSYLYTGFEDQDLLNRKFEQWFTPQFRGQKLVQSEGGNFELWKINQSAPVLESDGLMFRKVSPVKFQLLLKNPTPGQVLTFNDSFSSGWSLYLGEPKGFGDCLNPVKDSTSDVTECGRESRLVDFEDIFFLKQRPLDWGHVRSKNKVGNVWHLQGDGKELMITLYFRPQNYFYLGSIFSILVFLILVALSLRARIRNHL